ncbi:MAG: orotidine-5'-phosphate decarboxylase [Lentisphaerae bacterium]|nr:orotidine-5'-phosphate decarboxylase [Lentisphaerota bacterium]
MKPELIVALDVPSHTAIPDIVRTLPSDIRWYKVGLELFTADGAEAIRFLKENNKNIFLDLKFHDIPRTVARAVQAAARQGADMLTVHATGGSDMLRAAADSAAELGDAAPLLLAVTTLTSLSQEDIGEIGITRPLKQQTLAMGQLAIDAGINGLVCSPLEAAEFRAALGPDTVLVTPGVRLKGGDVGDQKRVATPESAVEAGANFLVVGRPILGAPDPAAAADDFLGRIAQ